MFAKQIASESTRHGFCTRIVDLQDVVENDDLSSCIELLQKADDNKEDADNNNNEVVATYSRGENMDEDAMLLRATLAHPHYRDPSSDESETSSSSSSSRSRSKALFFMATYGEGEPTDNAQQFIQIMKAKSGISNIYKVGSSELNGGGDSSISLDEAASSSHNAATANNTEERDATFLNDVDYAVFGLGNRQYEHYNNMSKFVDAALYKCGAARIAPLGLGDDDDDLEGDFENWKDTVLWPTLTKKYVRGKVALDRVRRLSVENNEEQQQQSSALPPCHYVVEYVKEAKKSAAATHKAMDASLIQTSSKHYLQAVDCPVVATRELRDPSDPGSTLHMEIDISNHMNVMKYQTADNLGILPKNDSAVVEAVANALNYDLNKVFNLHPSDENNNDSSTTKKTKHALPFPTPCTVRECLERYCDLTGPPRRSDLKQLAPYARNDIDRKALLRMSSKEGKAEYKEKIVEAHIGIADIVTRLCTSIVCPLEHFIMICPRLQPRYYTISSSSTVHPTTIHITLAVLEEKKTKDGNEMFKGLCSSYLSGMKRGDMVRAFVRESTFRLPKQVERPVLMFGPGTGIAPMRAVLMERSHGLKNGVKHGPSILYFGCKDRSMDYIYRDELEAFEKEGTLTELHLAFSREQTKKVYVQHLLAKRGEESWKLIHDDKASIFVCGAVKMGADVDHTLQDIISEQGGMSREKAKAYLDKMAVSGRFVQELWS